jgi:branched-chain amino acid transport system substrate-binding protein
LKSVLFRNSWRAGLFTLYLAISAQGAWSQIKLGQTLDLSGVTSAFSKDFMRGTNAHLAAVNKNGGVAGKTLELVTLDDKFEPELTLENTRKLISDPAVLGLVGYRGTLNVQKVMPLLAEAKISMVGTSAGAMSLRKPVHPYLFHNRASLADEVEVLVNHAQLTGITKLAYGYQDDAFGKDGLAAFEAAMAKRDLKPVATGAVPRGTTDVTAAAAAIAQANPQMVIFVGQAKPAAALIRAIRKNGAIAQFMVTSVISGIHSELGEEAFGISVAQVVPSPFNPFASKLVQEYQAAMKAIGETKFTHNSLEGYLIARIMVRALQQAGANPTRASVHKALEAMRAEDIDGYMIKYSPTDHLGSKFVEINMVRKDGSFAR